MWNQTSWPFLTPRERGRRSQTVTAYRIVCRGFMVFCRNMFISPSPPLGPLHLSFAKLDHSPSDSLTCRSNSFFISVFETCTVFCCVCFSCGGNDKIKRTDTSEQVRNEQSTWRWIELVLRRDKNVVSAWYTAWLFEVYDNILQVLKASLAPELWRQSM